MSLVSKGGWGITQATSAQELLVAAIQASDEEKIPPTLQTLLAQFDQLFQDPTGLPPSRSYDHHTPLVSGAQPVNARPYRYAPLQKTEIERQVQEMLTSGIIQHSVSPFASPVLLVKKKDGTW